MPRVKCKTPEQRAAEKKRREERLQGTPDDDDDDLYIEDSPAITQEAR